jgi:hypothetical protein
MDTEGSYPAAGIFPGAARRVITIHGDEIPIHIFTATLAMYISYRYTVINGWMNPAGGFIIVPSQGQIGLTK